MISIASRVFGFLSSLKLAVVVVLGLAVALTFGTLYESKYDTRTGKYFVYGAWWFMALLGMLGLNILAVALSRIPWKRRHAAFLIAHLGILTLLLGSWITYKFGLDGSIRLEEGETSGAVQLEEASLVITEQGGSGKAARRVPIRWVPEARRFDAITVRSNEGYELKVDQFLPHADSKVAFVAEKGGEPAVKLKITGGPMRITQEFWLWAGQLGSSRTQLGPASFFLLNEKSATQLKISVKALEESLNAFPGPWLSLKASGAGKVAWRAKSSEGTFATGSAGSGEAIDPKWRGGVSLSVEEYIPEAASDVTYSPSRIQYGGSAPASAIHLTHGEGEGASKLWLGLGEHATLHLPDDRKLDLAYVPQRVVLPFSIRLERFTIHHYDGTRDPSSYESSVTVVDAEDAPGKPKGPVTIKMNHPLEYKGVTVYQASYEDADPRPTVSIFSVNRDPGRSLKYIGSILIVLGSILLFAMKTIRNPGFRTFMGVGPLQPKSRFEGEEALLGSSQN